MKLKQLSNLVLYPKLKSLKEVKSTQKWICQTWLYPLCVWLSGSLYCLVRCHHVSDVVRAVTKQTQWSLSFDVKPEMCWQKGKEEVSWLFSSKVTCLVWSDWCVVSLTDASGSWCMVLKKPICGLSPHNADDQLTVQLWHFQHSLLPRNIDQSNMYQILFHQRRWPRMFAR